MNLYLFRYSFSSRGADVFDGAGANAGVANASAGASAGARAGHFRGSYPYRFAVRRLSCKKLHDGAAPARGAVNHASCKRLA